MIRDAQRFDRCRDRVTHTRNIALLSRSCDFPTDFMRVPGLGVKVTKLNKNAGIIGESDKVATFYIREIS